MQHRSELPEIDEHLVRRLIVSQFPGWAHLPIAPVAAQGHDNRTFRLGADMSVRLPTGPAYAEHMTIEYQWLSRLAPYLPVPIPEPLAIGFPEHGFPWPWLVNRWVDGTEVVANDLLPPAEFAADVASFLASLQKVDTAGAPPPSAVNFFRGAHLCVYDSEVRDCIWQLREEIDVAATTKLWEQALESEWDRPPVWVHGDVAPGNLLVNRRRLCGVIDFGQLAAGDPACDVTVAWTLLSGKGREIFRSALPVDEGTWMRGRGWAVWKALLTLAENQQRGPKSWGRAASLIEALVAESR